MTSQQFYRSMWRSLPLGLAMSCSAVVDTGRYTFGAKPGDADILDADLDASQPDAGEGGPTMDVSKIGPADIGVAAPDAADGGSDAADGGGSDVSDTGPETESDADAGPAEPPCNARALCGAGALSCTIEGGAHSCVCGPGYDGNGSANCTPVDHCAAGLETTCGAGALSCMNRASGYTCTCRPGYQLGVAGNCQLREWNASSSFAPAIGEWDFAANRTGTAHVVYASGCALLGRFYGASGWSQPLMISYPSSDVCPTRPRAALNASAEALTFWAQYSTYGSLLTARYASTSSSVVESSAFASGSPGTASLDAQGLSIVSYVTSGQSNSVFAKWANDGGSWNAPATMLEDAGIWTGFSHATAFDAQGNALVIGIDRGGQGTSGSSLWVHRLAASDRSWTQQLMSQIVNSNGWALFEEAQLTMGPDASWGLAVWSNTLGMALSRISARAYSSGTWAAQTELNLQVGSLGDFVSAAGPAGSALVLAVVNGDVQVMERSTSGWSAPRSLDPGNTVSPESLDPENHIAKSALAIDDQGSAFAAWVRRGADHDELWSRVRPAGADWLPLQRVDSGQTAKTLSRPQLAAIATGRAIAVWQSSDGTSDSLMWSARQLP